MHRTHFRRAVIIALLCSASLAGAQESAVNDATLTLLATDPAPDATLASQQSFYVRFEVKSAAPVSVSINALHQGQPVPTNLGSSGYLRLPAGVGIGVAHFFYWGGKPTRIDEVRLTITGPGGAARQKEYAFPVNLTWSQHAATVPPAVAPWVTEWRAAESARQKAQVDERMRKGADEHTWAGTLTSGAITVAFTGILLAGLGLPLWGALKWRGRWRAAALAAGVPPALALTIISIDIGRGPASHSLTPLELGIWVVPSLALMTALCVARARQRRRGQLAAARARSD